MGDKNVILVGAGHIMQMVKYYLSEIIRVKVIEIDPATNEELMLLVNQEHPAAIIVEQSKASQGYLEMLLLITKETNIKVVEVSPHSNTIQVAKWNQVQLERMQDFLAVLQRQSNPFCFWRQV